MKTDIGAIIGGITLGKHIPETIGPEVLVNGEQGMTSIEIKATVGNLTILYGGRPQIEAGAKFVTLLFL